MAPLALVPGRDDIGVAVPSEHAIASCSPPSHDRMPPLDWSYYPEITSADDREPVCDELGDYGLVTGRVLGPAANQIARGLDERVHIQRLEEQGLLD